MRRGPEVVGEEGEQEQEPRRLSQQEEADRVLALQMQAGEDGGEEDDDEGLLNVDPVTEAVAQQRQRQQQRQQGGRDEDGGSSRSSLPPKKRPRGVVRFEDQQAPQARGGGACGGGGGLQLRATLDMEVEEADGTEGQGGEEWEGDAFDGGDPPPPPFSSPHTAAGGGDDAATGNGKPAAAAEGSQVAVGKEKDAKGDGWMPRRHHRPPTLSAASSSAAAAAAAEAGEEEEGGQAGGGQQQQQQQQQWRRRWEGEQEEEEEDDMPGRFDACAETPGVVGLNNLGNTCYMNASLQCLAATGPLRTFFLQNQHRAQINTKNTFGTGGVVARAFARLLHQVYPSPRPSPSASSSSSASAAAAAAASAATAIAPRRRTASYFSPEHLRRAIIHFAPNFGWYEQQDAQELLAYVLDKLHEDLNRAPPPPPPPPAAPSPPPTPKSQQEQKEEEDEGAAPTAAAAGAAAAAVAAAAGGATEGRWEPGFAGEAAEKEEEEGKDDGAAVGAKTAAPTAAAAAAAKEGDGKGEKEGEEGPVDPATAAARAWAAHRARNDSVIVDLLQGQHQSSLRCPAPACGHASRVYEPYMFLQLPIPLLATTDKDTSSATNEFDTYDGDDDDDDLYAVTVYRVPPSSSSGHDDDISIPFPRKYALRLRPAPDDTGYYYSNYRPRLSDLRCALAAAMSEEVNAPAHAPAPTGGGGEEEGGEPHQAQPTQPAAAAAAGAEEEEGQQQSPQAQPQPQSTAGGGAGVVVMPGSLAVVELSPNPFRWGRGEEARILGGIIDGRLDNPMLWPARPGHHGHPPRRLVAFWLPVGEWLDADAALLDADRTHQWQHAVAHHLVPPRLSSRYRGRAHPWPIEDLAKGVGVLRWCWGHWLGASRVAPTAVKEGEEEQEQGAALAAGRLTRGEIKGLLRRWAAGVRVARFHLHDLLPYVVLCRHVVWEEEEDRDRYNYHGPRLTPLPLLAPAALHVIPHRTTAADLRSQLLALARPRLQQLLLRRRRRFRRLLGDSDDEEEGEGDGEGWEAVAAGWGLMVERGGDVDILGDIDDEDDDNTPLFTLLFRIGDGNGDRDVGACYAPTEVAVVWSQAAIHRFGLDEKPPPPPRGDRSSKRARMAAGYGKGGMGGEETEEEGEQQPPQQQDDDFEPSGGEFALSEAPSYARWRAAVARRRARARALAQPTTLEACLGAFEAEEQLGESEAWTCDRCHAPQRGFKQLRLVKAPPILMVHLNRFKVETGRWGPCRVKIDKHVTFPLRGLDLRPHLLPLTPPPQPSPAAAAPPTTTPPAAAAAAAAAAGDKSTTTTSSTPTPTLAPTAAVGGSDMMDIDPPNAAPQQEEQEEEEQEETKGGASAAAAVAAEQGQEQQEALEEEGEEEEVKDKSLLLPPSPPPTDGASSSAQAQEQPQAQQQEDPEPVYDLYAVVNHMGGLGGGHYTAAALHDGTGRWHEFNDSFVSRLDPAEVVRRVVTPSAYVLFYLRRDLAPPPPPSSSPSPTAAAIAADHDDDDGFHGMAGGFVQVRCPSPPAVGMMHGGGASGGTVRDSDGDDASDRSTQAFGNEGAVQDSLYQFEQWQRNEWAARAGLGLGGEGGGDGGDCKREEEEEEEEGDGNEDEWEEETQYDPNY